MYHGHLRCDLTEVAVSADVVTLLLVEAGPGLDDGQLAAPESSTKWHHAPQLTKLIGKNKLLQQSYCEHFSGR